MAHYADTFRSKKVGGIEKLSATELTQVSLNKLSDAEGIFNYTTSTTHKPIVALGPKPCFPLCCFQCCLSVPSGYHLIFQKWNANWVVPSFTADGEKRYYKKEGLICCWPWYKRISHVVTQKAVRFNAPVANCPTKDVSAALLYFLLWLVFLIFSFSFCLKFYFFFFSFFFLLCFFIYLQRMFWLILMFHSIFKLLMHISLSCLWVLVDFKNYCVLKQKKQYVH